MTTELYDYEEKGVSNCCSAKVLLGVCAECKEHCEAVDEDEESVAIRERPWLMKI